MRLMNAFHHTFVTVRPSVSGYLSPRQVQRARKTLCGIGGCTCSDDNLGTRGMHNVRITPHQDGAVTVTRLG